jgi:hypothetical protein
MWGHQEFECQPRGCITDDKKFRPAKLKCPPDSVRIAGNALRQIFPAPEIQSATNIFRWHLSLGQSFD